MKQPCKYEENPPNGSWDNCWKSLDQSDCSCKCKSRSNVLACKSGLKVLKMKLLCEYEENLSSSSGDNDQKPLSQSDFSPECKLGQMCWYVNQLSEFITWSYGVNMKKIHQSVHEIMAGNLSANQVAAPSVNVGQMLWHANQLREALRQSYGVNLNRIDEVVQEIMDGNPSANQITEIRCHPEIKNGSNVLVCKSILGVSKTKLQCKYEENPSSCLGENGQKPLSQSDHRYKVRLRV